MTRRGCDATDVEQHGHGLGAVLRVGTEFGYL
jgi:hypothetical protein